MKDRIEELVKARPEFQDSSATKKVESLFGNDSSMSVGMGLGRKLGGKQPGFMAVGNRFGQGNFVQRRMGV